MYTHTREEGESEMVEQEEEEEPEKKERVFFFPSVLNGAREKKFKTCSSTLARVCFGIKESVIPVLQTTLNCVKLGIMYIRKKKGKKAYR